MIKASWMARIIVGVLWSAAGLADDVQSSNTDDEPVPVAAVSVETLLAESDYLSRWQPFHTAEAMAYSDNWRQPITDFDFQDTDALSQLFKLRSLSLLTLADYGRSRLFLGVNEEGLVGLHFDAIPHYGGERYLEVLRLPYLEKDGQ